MSKIDRAGFEHAFRATPTASVPVRTAAQRDAIRAADLNHNGTLDNNPAERAAAWGAVDRFDDALAPRR